MCRLFIIGGLFFSFPFSRICMPSLECFSKDTLWKIKKPTPPRNRGIPRENISRRRESTNKSRGSPLTLKVWQKCLNFSGTYSDVVVATPWLQRSNSCTFGGILASSRCSVTNSSSGLIFVKIRAESGQIFSKNPGKIRAKIRAKLNCVILSSFYDLGHVQTGILTYGKQLHNALNVH